jgi:hypothetical protein
MKHLEAPGNARLHSSREIRTRKATPRVACPWRSRPRDAQNGQPEMGNRIWIRKQDLPTLTGQNREADGQKQMDQLRKQNTRREPDPACCPLSLKLDV